MGLELLGVGTDDKPAATGPQRDKRQAWLAARATRLEEHLDSLGIIYDSIRVAEAIFDDLIAYDTQKHADVDAFALAYKTCDAATLVASITLPLSLNAHRNAVELSNLIEPADPAGLVLVDVDQRRISQVLRTLMSHVSCLMSHVSYFMFHGCKRDCLLTIPPPPPPPPPTRISPRCCERPIVTGWPAWTRLPPHIQARQPYPRHLAAPHRLSLPPPPGRSLPRHGQASASAHHLEEARRATDAAATEQAALDAALQVHRWPAWKCCL